MAFKMVTDSEKAAGRVAGTALAHAGMIAGEPTARWRDRLPEGQEVVDLEQLQRFHGEELHQLRRELIEKEAAHLDRLAEIRETRERRDVAARSVRQRLFKIRDLFEVVHGKRGSRPLFLGEPVIPVDATPLRRVARTVVDSLTDPDLDLPSVTLQGVELSRPTTCQ